LVLSAACVSVPVPVEVVLSVYCFYPALFIQDYHTNLGTKQKELKTKEKKILSRKVKVLEL